jgi:glycosyltransferase involved in cell wall biosynthesis
MVIGLDTSALHPEFKAHAARGIGRYVSELTKYLSSHTTRPVVEYFDYSWFLLPKHFETLLSCVPVGRQTLRQQLVYPLQLGGWKTKGYSLLHFPAHMDAPSWTQKPYVLTVLDLIPLILSDLYRAERANVRFYFARWLELRAIRNAQALIAISECTKRDLIRVLNIPEEKIFVTPLGVDERFFEVLDKSKRYAVRDKLHVAPETPIILYIGGIDQRKNANGLIKLFGEVVRGCREQGRDVPVLVMAGKIQNERQYPQLVNEIVRSGVSDKVILPGFVPDEELRALLQESAVFVFPSLYEGFGLPPLEAAAAGVPVVSSNTSSLPEVLGDSALLFDPYAPESGARLVLEILASPELARTAAESGRKRARQFTWKRTGDLTVEVYERVTEALNVRDQHVK